MTFEANGHLKVLSFRVGDSEREADRQTRALSWRTLRRAREKGTDTDNRGEERYANFTGDIQFRG